MEARIVRVVILAAALSSLGASYRTPNFVVQAPSQALAEEIGKAAEKYRRDLAMEWLGSPMRNWSQPCPIVAKVANHLGAGGATSFLFDRGQVFGWQMEIQGSRERILDSVLPHEVTHTIFATHFRQPLPRWADEGACTTVEHISEKNKQQQMLIEFLQTGRGIAFSKMFAMKEYPRDVLPLYSQGYSLARFLIAQGGKHKFMKYVGDGLKSENWTATTRQHYGYDNLSNLQTSWLSWVKQGSPQSIPGRSSDVLIAGVNGPGGRVNGTASATGGPEPRFQSPDTTSEENVTAATGVNVEPAATDLASSGPGTSEWESAAPATRQMVSGQGSIYKQGAAGATVGSPLALERRILEPSEPRQSTSARPAQRETVLEWSKRDTDTVRR